MIEKNGVTVLPPGWSWTTLGEVADYVNGRAFKPTEWSEVGRPIIRIQNLTGSTSVVNRYSGAIQEKFLVHDGDLLISWSATLGAFIYHGEEAVLNQHIFRVNPFVDKRFLFYATSACLSELRTKVHGSGMQHITKDPFRQFAFPLPPVAEQRRIVSKIEELFTRLDAGVEELTKVKAQLKRYRQAVLKAAFEGKLTAEWREAHQDELDPASMLLERIEAERQAGAAGRSARSANVGAKAAQQGAGADAADQRVGAIHELPLQDRCERPLPPGWVWTCLGDVTANHDSRRIPLKQTDRADRHGPYAYYGASGIIDHIDGYIFDGHYLLLAEDGANLLSRSTPIAFEAGGRFWVNNHAHVLTTHGNIPLRYLEHQLNATDLSFHVTGTAQPKLTQKNMNLIPVALAPSAEQHRLVADRTPPLRGRRAGRDH